MAFLDGYRVLDLTDERGLLAGRMLADLGADVVQVEPVGGSTARDRPPYGPVAGGPAEAPTSPAGRGGRPVRSYYWDAFAANKRGIEVDLDSAAGQQQVAGLAAAADVLIESAGPGIMAARGLDYADLRDLNPRLVYVSITPFGRTGPKAGYHASDLVVWAAGGALDEHRDGGRPPLRISLPQAYLQAAADAAGGALLALHARARTGRGQLVDVSAQASLGTATLGRVLRHAFGDIPRDMEKGYSLLVAKVDHSGSGSATDPALKKWPCRDGLIEFHIGVGPVVGGFTSAFFGWMAAEGGPAGRFATVDWRQVPELIASGEFTDDDAREARDAVATFLAGQTKQEVLDAAVERKLLCVPVYDTADVQVSAQLAARDFWTEIGDGDRRMRIPGAFAKVSVDAFAIRRPAPLLGEHTAEVTAQWLQPPPPPQQRQAEQGPAEHGEDRNRDLAAIRPLDGLKVLDLSWVVAGPVIGRALADFGATVVRVESSTRIETARYMQPFHHGEFGPENSALYATWNAGKLGVTLDLQTEQGREVVRDLARWADVVIESFSPGLMVRWGLDYQSLSAGHASLIMLSTSINGQTGPQARLAGYGNIGAALSGFQAIVGWPDRPPFGPYGPYTDYVGPRFGLATLLSALDYRSRTGLGCYIDVSQVEAGVYLQSPELADNAANGTVVERIGNADREFAPHGVYPCLPDPADEAADRFVAIAVTSDEQWQRIAAAIGRLDLGADPDLRTAAGRRARSAELDAAVADWTARHSAEEIEYRLQAAGVPAHVSASSKDFCTDVQLAHRGHLITLPHPLLGNTTVEGPRYLLSQTPGRPDRAAPTFGQDTEHVLTDILGYDRARVSELAAAGILR